MSDGIDVILDQWSLEHGHDVNVFMEKMVSDPTIKRVLIISDSLYASKADGRAGGVGTETQIISKKVYESVDQTKFIPLLRERDSDGKACLPVYLDTRKFIDFSDPDTEPAAYDQLIRNIFERPNRPKPVLGRPPAHVLDEQTTSVASAQKAKRLREIIASGKGSVSICFEDFSDEFISDLEDLRMAYTQEGKNTWCDRIRRNIAVAKLHRDIFVDVIKTGAKHIPQEEFLPSLLQLLERILPLTERPEPNTGGLIYECSEDNYKFLAYELFLYSFAVLVSSKKYDAARQLIDHRYFASVIYGGQERDLFPFTSFNQYARSLEDLCSKQGSNRRLSVMSDLLHDRANREDVRYSDLYQADVLLCLAANGRDWYPRSMIRSRGVGKLELFVRADSIEGFRPLGTLLNLNKPRELVTLIESEAMTQVFSSSQFFQADVSLGPLNFDALKRMWKA